MELLLLALYILLVGFAFIFCTKSKYKGKILGIFTIISLLTLYYPCHIILSLGTAKELNLNFLFLSQKLMLIMDPITAFSNILLIVPCLLYAFNIFVNRNRNIDCWIPETLIMTVLLALFSINVHNGIYFFVGISLFNTCLLLLTNKFSANLTEARNKSLLIYIFSIVIATLIMVLGMFSHSFQFSEIVKSLVSNIDYSNAVFVMVFIGFGLPLVLSEYLFNTNNLLQNPNYRELFLVKIITLVLYFYGLLRFVGMGAVPVLKTNYIIMVVLAVFVLIHLYKLYKSRLIQNIYSHMNTVQITVMIISILVGVMGYIYKVPVISILGYISALFFLTNILISDYAMRYNLDEISISNIKVNSKAEVMIIGSGYRKMFPISIFNYVGLPYTIGFIGWITLFGTGIFGIISLNNELRLFSIYAIILFLLIFIALMINVFFILKRHFYLSSNPVVTTSIPILSGCLAVLTMIFGIFPSQLLKIIIVPVSFLNGGTKYALIFDAIKSISITYTFYMLGIIILLVFYIVTKLLIFKLIKNRQK